MSQRIENLKKSGLNKVTANDKDFYYALTTFEVQMLATRNSFMLVFQSMLFTAMAILDGKPGIVFPLPILPILGIACSFLWLYINSMTHAIEEIAYARLEHANEHIKETIALSKQFPSIFKSGNISAIMTYPFPMLTMGTWIIWLAAVLKSW